MAERRLHLVWSLVGLSLAVPDFAEARDAGPTWPVAAFLAERLPEGAGTSLVSDAATSYPVLPRQMRAGVLRQPTRLAAGQLRWMEHPIALIGDEARSRAWLNRHGDLLLRLGAQVVVVEVTSAARMRTLRQLRADLPMAAGETLSLEQALKAAGAPVYPLLIQADGSVRQDLADAVGGVR